MLTLLSLDQMNLKAKFRSFSPVQPPRNAASIPITLIHTSTSAVLLAIQVFQKNVLLEVKSDGHAYATVIDLETSKILINTACISMLYHKANFGSFCTGQPKHECWFYFVSFPSDFNTCCTRSYSDISKGIQSWHQPCEVVVAISNKCAYFPFMFPMAHTYPCRGRAAHHSLLTIQSSRGPNRAHGRP